MADAHVPHARRPNGMRPAAPLSTLPASLWARDLYSLMASTRALASVGRAYQPAIHLFVERHMYQQAPTSLIRQAIASAHQLSRHLSLRAAHHLLPRPPPPRRQPIHAQPTTAHTAPSHPTMTSVVTYPPCVGRVGDERHVDDPRGVLVVLLLHMLRLVHVIADDRPRVAAPRSCVSARCRM